MSTPTYVRRLFGNGNFLFFVAFLQCNACRDIWIQKYQKKNFRSYHTLSKYAHDILQPDQINIAVLFWYLVKSEQCTVAYSSVLEGIYIL